VKFSEQPPSKQWAVLKYRGERFAEVWFKPEGEPLAVRFRIARESFQIPGASQLLTPENLLKAIAVTPEEVESWRHGSVTHPGMDGANPDLRVSLPPPGEDVTHLYLFFSLQPAPEVIAPEESAEPETPEPTELPPQAEPREVAPGEGDVHEIPSVRWQDLDARWRAVQGVEGTIDNLRVTLEGLQAQMETAAKQTLTTEEKVDALHADVAQWTKAKTRVHHAVPKVHEFVHRATWVVGTPERKKLEELFKDEDPPEMSLPEMIKLVDQLENLLKDRQVLAAQGVTVCQECRKVASGIESSLRNLKANAAARADKRRRAGRPKGKFFKHIRKWSGAD
jgi:hypothetical protein